jgi:hypothetical protein
VPPPVIERSHAVTLACRVADQPLAPARYDRAGDFLYAGDAAQPIADATPKVECTVDPPFFTGGADTRALGLVVVNVALLAR